MIKIGLTDFTPANKIINIRDKNQVILAQKAIGAEDILKCTLMNEHYIELHFALNEKVSFKRSDYIEWEGEKYTLREDYQPEETSKKAYKYTLKFEAVEMLFQDVQYFYLNQGLKESEWRLIGNPEYFIKMAVDNINRYFGVTDFAVGTVEPTETKDILFETDTNTFDALTQIAEEYNAEWYITGKTIHLLNKVSFGSEVNFETEVSVSSMKRNAGDGGTKYNRIVALGSTRNIPKNYRTPSSGESVDAIYPKRLRIPIAKGDVIDAYPGMSPDEVVEGTVIFDDIYPKRVGTIQAVGTIEYTDTDEETGTQTKWNAYKFKDSGIDFKEEYVLPGEELRLVFESGKLNGMDFALIFHDKGFSDSDNSQYFEIVRNDDYGKDLPNDILKPNIGDKYVLYGFDIALVSNQYVPEAEQELYDTASTWLQDQLKDTSVYECPTVIQYFMDNLMDLAIGQNVKLVNIPFNTDNRSSRIMGFEKKLNNKYDATYTVGDNSAYSRLAGIEKDIQELQHAGIVYTNTGGNGVYVIKQFDTTRPSDFNVYSAQASNAKYFNKQTGDTVQGDALFLRNVQTQGLNISDVFQNSTFTAGQLGSGFQVKRDANGQSYMEVDNLLVRREAVFNRLTIAEIKSVGGTILLSLANMLVLQVEDTGSTWKCFFDTGDGTIPNDFAVGDQAICRKFTGQNIKYYWALVTAVGTDYIELSKADKDGSGVPDVGDEVVQLGNRTDVNRQHAIMLSAYGSDAPSIKQYSGINSYDLTGKEVTTISPSGNKFTGSFTVATNGTTAPVYKERGAFVNGTVYYLNDRVSYLGSLWVCIVSSTITTPNETSVTWRKETTGQTDIDGLRSEYKADFVVLDTKIASKVSQTDFDALGNRVSNTESSITQLSNSITSVVEKVDNIKIGGRNYNFNFEKWGLGNATIELLNGNANSILLSSINAASNAAIVSNVINRQGYFICSVYVKTTEPTTIYIDSRGTVITSSHEQYRTDTVNFTLPVGFNERIVIYSYSDLAVNNNWYIGILATSIGKSVQLSYPQLELGTIPTDWTPAPEDMETGNVTYYQDEVPTVPSGGHKEGDLWYKTSLVDSSGNINTDTSKNIYQLQYRWNGSTWIQINWSVAKSKIEQTDSSINLIVEKTGINSVGAGSSLYSMINQTAEQITLEVSKLQIGGRNLVSGSSTGVGWIGGIWQGNNTFKVTKAATTETGYIYSPRFNLYAGQEIVVSFEHKADSAIISCEIFLLPTNYTTVGLLRANYAKSTDWAKAVIKFIAPASWGNIDNPVDPLLRFDHNGSVGGVSASIWVKNVKVELGNKETDWTTAPEDIPEIAGSALTLTSNKISLASKTIELKGQTIADAITIGGDLKVGSRSGASALEVLRSGTFYAKGSAGSDTSLIIDSGTQSIEIISPFSASWDGDGGSIPSGRSTVKISSQSGGVTVSDSSYNTALMSPNGVFANKAGQGVYSLSTGINAKAAIAGVGNGNVANLSGKDFIAGVYGRAANSGTAPAYGGYFDILKANGLYFNVRQITTETLTYLSATDCYISAYNTVTVSVYLPYNPLTGQVIFIRRMNSAGVTVYGYGKSIHTDGSLIPSVGVGGGRGDTAMFIYDGSYWTYNYMGR